MDIKKTIIGVLNAMAPISTAGMLSMYTDVKLNTEHRIESKEVVDDIKALRKDVCWIKEHLRGEKVPSCDM